MCGHRHSSHPSRARRGRSGASGLRNAPIQPTDQLVASLLEAAPDAIIAVDEAGRIVLVNAQTERMFGYRREDLVGRAVEELIPADLRTGHPTHRAAYMDSPRPRPMGAGLRLTGLRADGSEFAAEISLSPAPFEDGLLVVVVIRDVEDHQRAEAKFRGLLEAAPDAMVCVDVAGSITLINARAEELFGYTREELIGQPVEVLVPAAVRSAHSDHRRGFLADPRSRPMGVGMQLVARRKDGSEFPAEISLGPMQTEQGPIVSAAVRDVTERLEIEAERERLRVQAEEERLQRRLQQSQRLESLGQLAGGVAHDFNNLLAVILNYTTFVIEEITQAAMDAGPGRWEAVREDLGQIQRAAERASGLTHQLLAFARREVVRPQAVDLNHVIRDLEPMLRRTIGEHVRLGTSLADGLLPVLADPGQMEQVLVNLAVNARDAMADGGTLTIDTENIVVDDDFASLNPGVGTGQHIRLRVSDTGPGMAQAVQARAFDPFFTTKPKGEGSGLGLATVYGIVSQSSGHVQLYSEPGLGVTVTVLLPATDQVLAARPQAGEHARGAGETILVVEDEAAMREVARRILARNGYQVVVAADGPAALAAARSHTGVIDLLLTDVVMPRMLGKEVADRIRALRPRIQVLYMSGYAKPVLAAQGTLDDGITLIQKPFSEQALLGKVREVLDDAAPAPEATKPVQP
jgi:hypothetical protein